MQVLIKQTAVIRKRWCWKVDDLSAPVCSKESMNKTLPFPSIAESILASFLYNTLFLPLLKLLPMELCFLKTDYQSLLDRIATFKMVI